MGAEGGTEVVVVLELGLCLRLPLLDEEGGEGEDAVGAGTSESPCYTERHSVLFHAQLSDDVLTLGGELLPLFDCAKESKLALAFRNGFEYRRVCFNVGGSIGPVNTEFRQHEDGLCGFRC